MYKLGLLLWLTINLVAEENHYQLGLGMGVVTYPSYIGSKSTHQIIAPIPYIRYQSEKTTIGKGGISRKLFDNNDLSLDLSLGASLPVDSDNARPREGMHDLDFALELGPRLRYTFYKDEEHKVSVNLPLRAVVSINTEKLDTQGFLFTPNLNYQLKLNNVQFKLKTGPLWADKEYHNYFYGVAKQYETVNRKSYDAQRGYNGYRNTLSVKYKQGAWNYGAFISHFNIDGAVFENSPLIETKNGLFLGTFVSYVFYAR
jgi:outer membrane scaffolding protein for murein synthesis (MipA/OmpV family)